MALAVFADKYAASNSIGRVTGLYPVLASDGSDVAGSSPAWPIRKDLKYESAFYSKVLLLRERT